MGGIGIWQLLIILVIVVLIFGAKRLRTLGGDLGASVKGFRQAMKDGESESKSKNESEDTASASSQERVIESEKDHIIDAEVVKEKDRA